MTYSYLIARRGPIGVTSGDSNDRENSYFWRYKVNMKAVIYNRKSHPDKLVYCDIDKPVPNDNEVLIKVHSVSLNAADYRSKKIGLIPKRKIFGADIAGRIET